MNRGLNIMSAQKIILPDFEALWKWPRMVNPYLPDVDQESVKWSASFGAFPPEVHALVHEKGKMGASKSTLRWSYSFISGDIGLTGPIWQAYWQECATHA